MAKHLIIFGHSPDGKPDPGTTTSKLKEAVEVRKLKPHLEKWGKESKDEFIFYEGSVYGDRNMAKQTGYDSVTELHMDGPKGNGGHVIIFRGYEPDAIDLRLRDLIEKHWGIVGYLQSTKGISYRGDLYNPNEAARAGINYRLLELFFMSNKEHHEYYLKNLDSIAKEMVEAITGESIKVNTKPTADVKPAPKPAPKPEKKSAEQVAQDIAVGKGGWGNNPERAKKLTKAGYDAKAVQARVNDIVKVKTVPKKPSGPRVGQTITTRTLYANSASTKNVRSSPVKGYIHSINNSWKNPIRLTNGKNGSWLGFTRPGDIL